MCVYLGERSSSQHHAVIVAAAGDGLVFIGQNDVPMSCGGVKGEPSHCRKETAVGHDATSACQSSFLNRVLLRKTE